MFFFSRPVKLEEPKSIASPKNDKSSYRLFQGVSLLRKYIMSNVFESCLSFLHSLRVRQGKIAFYD